MFLGGGGLSYEASGYMPKTPTEFPNLSSYLEQQTPCLTLLSPVSHATMSCGSDTSSARKQESRACAWSAPRVEAITWGRGTPS